MRRELFLFFSVNLSDLESALLRIDGLHDNRDNDHLQQTEPTSSMKGEA